MTALEVVGMDVLPDRSSGLLDVVPFCQVGFLILERAEPPLDLDVVSPAALAVHTLTYLVSLQKILVALAGELAALIRIRISGFATRKAFLHASIQEVASSVSSRSQPTIQRLYQSMIAVRYRKLCFSGM